MKIICKSINELPDAAEVFVNNMGKNRIFDFQGEMGAGKTTFISEICHRLGCQDDASSPTFSIVNEYPDRNNIPVYHFDFYRLKQPAEAIDIGIEEYFYSGYPCFIEWGEKIGNLMPEDAIPVKISVDSIGNRTIEF